MSPSRTVRSQDIFCSVIAYLANDSFIWVDCLHVGDQFAKYGIFRFFTGKRSVTSSVKGFRLDNEILSQLSKDSKKLRVTLSNHVCSILTNYNGSYRHLERLHYIWSSRELIRELIKKMDNKCLEIISEIVARDLKKQVRYSQGKFDVKETMEIIEANCLIQDMPFTEKDLPDGSIRYTIFHDMGKNWSTINKLMFESIFKDTKTRPMDFESNGEYMSFAISVD